MVTDICICLLGLSTGKIKFSSFLQGAVLQFGAVYQRLLLLQRNEARDASVEIIKNNSGMIGNLYSLSTYMEGEE